MVGYPQCLAQGMGNHNDGILLLQLHEKVLDGLAGNRVKRTRCLVRENEIRLDSQAAGQAKPLLLADRQSLCGTLKPVLDLVPESDLGEISLHDLCKFLLFRMHSVNPASVGHIVEYGHRKRARPLRHQADSPAEFDEVPVRSRDNILVPYHYPSAYGCVIDIVYQSVEAFEKSTLATA